MCHFSVAVIGFTLVRIIREDFLEPGARKTLARKDHSVRKRLSLHDIFSIKICVLNETLLLLKPSILQFYDIIRGKQKNKKRRTSRRRKLNLRLRDVLGFLIGAMDRRKSDVPTEIFSQGLEKPLAREREKPL